ncbi:MerR family transcriptional regulator [Actinomadura verrucosospora]|uniref:MerR family transcriptional regulator n=1 Tax=Actinomadura verrucosospora TaxID=46165 RepID=A0A7D4AQU6_ACTVE|nr:MerR family transcriptional regulator [Actinomadura verrucosospora]
MINDLVWSREGLDEVVDAASAG